ncbi:hypothetical protein A2715_00740 [Candidatus Woesebacteria bacterium RIFCSPHIGHO2_01_FULL_39_32]|uniref:Uncharacterized protein n=1 Tax=Candidatus Woesebacteria bacterium RIFCSPLOWO2_01_FULL_39_25 TaxID=1802521 RepID=A0A1F8BKE6_9BACT|nr:MAG: hypothetical protein A2124_03540 [Candidatus Woesebacteria bacterium GWB1_37_5]OGM24442.1 MAG: hypothetical protein A2715_00740 [Candidatus Woesebacteria bacterium RIFCSPHIGHO2_01_FULL_39_32]OGM35553.1 MAG: hypothetical protein A3F01_02530 [Candidatus Woesebacteria bacterium RIFCSPHIGHO2_12_FULL_38_11]OGM63748.1 MAG: hypothetical protein A2893_02075 [Candidatus Woesebacteria bacterium RIFCSPLOWO2_01_FULL_39_25]
MSLRERLLGSDHERKSTGEKLSRISKLIDVGTIFAALVFGGLAPALANTLIQASVVTYAGAEVYEQHKKRKRKK